MPHALARPRLHLALGLVTAASLACGRGRSGAGGDAGDPVIQAIEARMPPIERPEVGPGPGFLAGGMVYVAARPSELQRFLQGIPVDPNAARDIARAGAELGFDPRIDDVTARLGLDPAGVITATLGRPIAPQLPAVRDALRGLQSAPPPGLPDPFPGASATPADVAPDPIFRRPPDPIPPPVPPPVPPPHPDYDRFDPPPLPPDPLKPPPPPPPSADREAMARGAGAMALHFRAHMPAKDPAALPLLLTRLMKKERAPEIAALCGQIGPSDFCFGDSGAAMILRREPAAVVLDFFLFPAGTGAAWDQERVKTVTTGLAAAPATLPALAGLRGDFAAYADGAALPEVAEVVEVADAVSDLRWYDPSSIPRRVQKALGQREALERLRATRRLFGGVRLEAAFEPDVVQATLSWDPVDEAAAAAAEKTFTRAAAGLPVPTLAGLCEGALACWRGGGLPSLSALGELAIGEYAKDPRAFGDAIEASGDVGPAVLFLETWPNGLGMVQRWGAEQKGVEAAMARTALEIVGRVEGSGGSLRSLKIADRSVHTDYVTYARMPGSDLALFRSLVGFGKVQFAPTTLSGVEAKVEAAQVPSGEVPAQLFLVTDPGTVRVGDKDVEFGWLVAADGPDRLRWLLKDIAQENTALPAAYFELPDLWQLVAGFEDGPRELGFLQSWLSGRSVRFAADVVGGRVRLDLELARRGAAPGPAAVAK